MTFSCEQSMPLPFGRKTECTPTTIFTCQTGIIQAGKDPWDHGEILVDGVSLSEALAAAMNDLKVYHTSNGGFAGNIMVRVEAFGEPLKDESKEDLENGLGL